MNFPSRIQTFQKPLGENVVTDDSKNDKSQMAFHWYLESRIGADQGFELLRQAYTLSNRKIRYVDSFLSCLIFLVNIILITPLAPRSFVDVGTTEF